MTKRLRLAVAALVAMSLLMAPALTATASAHGATRVDTRPRYVCEYVYVPEFITYEAVCEWRSENRIVKRWHIHTSTRVCRWIQIGTTVTGALIGKAASGATAGVVGGGIGSGIGYELCESETGIIWLT